MAGACQKSSLSCYSVNRIDVMTCDYCGRMFSLNWSFAYYADEKWTFCSQVCYDKAYKQWRGDITQTEKKRGNK